MKLMCFLLIVISLVACQSNSKKYTFGRLHNSSYDQVEVRGGTTSGPDLNFDETTSEYFEKIQTVKSKKEKDKMAILAQTGDYKVSFEFLETMGYAKNYKLDKPYFSWATEIVVPIKETDNFISLQHILVMKLKGKDPYVVKHWRQDWSYQNPRFMQYVGHQTWKKEKLSKNEIKGTWTQEVYQVDDSPRYSSYGKWEHYSDHSVWESHITNRPLPRREHSVRSDYDMLRGVNRVIVKADGWIHEQSNEKVVVDKKTLKPTKVLAKEMGVNRYERIKGFDFSVGQKYWENTSDYWASVRDRWNSLIKKNDKISFKTKKEDGTKLYQEHFDFAEKLNSGEKLSPEKMEEHAKITIDKFLN